MSEAYDVTKIKPAQLLSKNGIKSGAVQSPAEIAEAVKALQQELAELRKLVRAAGPATRATPAAPPTPIVQN